MAVDKNLFLYDLAVVTIMKNEAPYVKEWLEYHLLAGVNHFYIYDNESPDNLKEVLQPYIDAGFVTYKLYPGKARQYEAYNEAVQDYKFFCRYMAFIDADEFIFPQNNKSIVEVVDEVFNLCPQAGGLAVNIFAFGSNFQEKADYSKGVLERFTRRAPVEWCPPMPELQNLPGGTAHVSTITNPRRVHHFGSPHYANYFEGCYAVNSNGGKVPMFFNNPPVVDKIVMNHYSIKSKEEYFLKINRGAADNKTNIYNLERFKRDDHNEVFDDSILKYRYSRYTEGGGILKRVNYQQAYISLLQNLSPTFDKNESKEIFHGKVENFLICRKLACHLREKVINEHAGNFFEESALNAVYKALLTNVSFIEIRLLVAELPQILNLNYPVIKNIRKACEVFISQMLDIYRSPYIEGWKEFVNLKYTLEMLQTFDLYERKN